jgi:hypothetical protein
MPVTKPYFSGLDILIVDLARRASGKSAAVRSLKIAELDERDRCIGVPLEVLHLGN